MWTLEVSAGVPCWRVDGAGGVRMAFSTRGGGVSEPPFDTLNLGRSTADRQEAVAENRLRMIAAAGLEPQRLVTIGQVHGSRTAEATGPGFHAERDGVVTTVAGLALAVSAADCLPLLLVARDGAGHVVGVGAAHAGWRGTADGVVGKTVAALRAAAIATDHIEAHLGPCIRSCCYMVGPEVAARFHVSAQRRVGERPHLDIPQAVRLDLLAAGVHPGAIHDVGACTACEPDRYFSHRRDHGLTGRHWGIIGFGTPRT